MWRPSHLDPPKKYPVIEQIYTRPHGFFAPVTIAADRSVCQSIAELGFACVMVDGMGTNMRSRAFHEVSYTNNHRLDNAWWVELWMGHPAGKHHEEQSNVTLAKNLKGKLLLAHGDVDENVPKVETMRLVDALIKPTRTSTCSSCPTGTTASPTTPTSFPGAGTSSCGICWQ